MGGSMLNFILIVINIIPYLTFKEGIMVTIIIILNLIALST